MKYSSASADLFELQGDVEQRVLAGDLEDVVGDLADDRGARVVVLVDAVPEALRCARGPPSRDCTKARTLSIDSDLGQHLHTCFVGSAVPGAVEGGAARPTRVRVGVGGADDPHRRRRAVLLVVGVQDEQDVDRVGEDRVGLEAGSADLPHHRQEVLAEAQRRRRGGRTASPTVKRWRGGERRHLGDQAHDLELAVLGVGDVLGLRVEGRERRDRGDEHPHRVGALVEAGDEPLDELLVDEGVTGDVGVPGGQLCCCRQLAVGQQVGDLEVGGLLGELLDRVAPVLEDPGLAVDEGDRALAQRRRREARGRRTRRRGAAWRTRRGDPAVDDRDLDRLAGAVVGDGDALGHDGDLLGSASSLIAILGEESKRPPFTFPGDPSRPGSGSRSGLERDPVHVGLPADEAELLVEAVRVDPRRA